MGWVWLQTDGASKGNPGSVRVGGIIRGHGGEVFELYAMNCGDCMCTRAELLAVVRGLAIAWNGGHRKVKLKIDSQVVVHMLMDATPPYSPYIHLIRKCKAIITRQGWEVKVGHCFSEENKAADWLANHGVLSASRLKMIEAVPPELQQIIMDDL